jgi:hypothetical protein
MNSPIIMTSIDRHHLAAISIVGSFLDVLGALYLAYDILGGKYGPLRALTRGVTYGVIFGVGFGLPLGLAFGLAGGSANGLTLAFELRRAAQQKQHYRMRYEALFSSIRGIGFGIGAAYMYGIRFGVVFGILSTLGQMFAYSRGIRPSLDYQPARMPRMSRRQIIAAVVRTGGYATAGYISAAVARQQMHALSFGIDAGLTIGIVTALANASMPFIEWITESVPDKRFGVFGVVLILCGFGMQSVQYWIALLDVAIQ